MVWFGSFLQHTRPDQTLLCFTPLQENATKPDHLPPNQGGKYVGFGSNPAPQPPKRPAPAVDDVTVLFSKGLQQLGQVAGAAASTASVAVRSGTSSINTLLQEKHVGETAQVLSEKGMRMAQVGTRCCIASSVWVSGV